MGPNHTERLVDGQDVVAPGRPNYRQLLDRARTAQTVGGWNSGACFSGSTASPASTGDPNTLDLGVVAQLAAAIRSGFKRRRPAGQ